MGSAAEFTLGFKLGAVAAAAAPEALLTPCIGICTLDSAGHCQGCQRSGDEIARWSSMTAAERTYLMDVELPQREANLA